MPMKRLLLLFVFLLSCVSVFAQKEEYSIIVKDIETLEPIQNATVIIMKTQQILLSNEEEK